MEHPKLEVADILRRYGGAYRETNGPSLSTAQRRVMSAIELCRTAALGGHLEQSDRCEHRRVFYNSCRDRHCPKCQSLARAEWIEDRQTELLNCEYFHVVFTVPEAISSIAYQNKEVVYGLLFRAMANTLQTIAADPKHLGAAIGFFAVLHTWGQNLLHHPHLHCVVPGGGLSPDGKRWVPCRRGFFLPVRVLSRLFRRLFLEELEKAFRSGSSLLSCHYRTVRPSAVTWLRSANPNGWFTPSRLLLDRSRYSTMWDVIRTALRSPTIACLISKMAKDIIMREMESSSGHSDTHPVHHPISILLRWHRSVD
jgi:hypothetical protein